MGNGMGDSHIGKSHEQNAMRVRALRQVRHDQPRLYFPHAQNHAHARAHTHTLSRAACQFDESPPAGI